MMHLPYYSLTTYLKETYGEKMYKISLNANMTCPNRDGTLGTKGCIFCSSGGSGDFAEDPKLSITEQIEAGKKKIENKSNCEHYIAYFQAYTNTYAPISYLRKVFYEAMMHPQIAILSIATRPDCLSDEVLSLLSELVQIKPIWVELGLQTIHPSSATYIRRGYALSCFDTAVQRLHTVGIDVIAHVILGLPGETKADMLATATHVADMQVEGIKLQLLHILKGTDLASEYEKNKFEVLQLSEYTDIVVSIIEHLPPQMVIHRITGDGPKNLLIAPLWSGNKRNVLNTINHEFRIRNTWQGKHR